jgi:cell division protein FtsQ
MPSKAKASGGTPGAALVPLALLLAAVTGVLGWFWVTTLPCRQITVTGTHHAAPDALLDLARVDTGMVLFDVDPGAVEARLQRHPWVQAAHVTRLPTGTLSIRIEERTPVALALDGAGAPARYLDRAGFAMPLAAGVLYDVPLVRGLGAPPAGKPLDHATALALLAALATIDAETDALLSELEVRPSGEAWLYTAPSGPYGSIPVRLGRGPFADQFTRLKAFWHQGVLTRPDRRFTLVDLRFDSQVVTHEEPAPPPQPSGPDAGKPTAEGDTAENGDSYGTENE